MVKIETRAFWKPTLDVMICCTHLSKSSRAIFPAKKSRLQTFPQIHIIKCHWFLKKNFLTNCSAVELLDRFYAFGEH